MPLYAEGMEGPPDGFTLMAGMVRPQSRGSIRLTESGGLAIDPACLSAQEDVDALVAAVELCREIGGQSALREWGAVEAHPGTGADLVDHVRQTAITYHHQVGTCRMGVDELAVVDPELRVRGLEGLRIADASVMPSVTAGNTHAPTVMIAERASDLVLAAVG